MEPVKFFFDPLCPWCYQTSRWARRLAELGEVDLDWGVFSLEIVNLEEGKDPAELDARAGPALRTAVVIRDTEGSKAIGRFYAALGARTWESAPPGAFDEETVKAALEDSGFDPGLCDKAMSDPSTWTAVIEEHKSLTDRTRSFGVPTIVLDGGTGPAIFGPVISELPNDDDAVELFHHVAWLSRYANFSELKRDRVKPPALPAAEWYRQQREKAKTQTGA